jgi:hypothetical protein
MAVGPEIRKTAKRFVLAVGFALLLPGVAGAAGFRPAERSFWEDWENPAALFARIWESWEELTGVWMTGGSIDPNGEGPDRPEACAGSDCTPVIDPNV